MGIVRKPHVEGIKRPRLAYEGLARKFVDGARERNFAFRERGIVSFSSLHTFKNSCFPSCSLQACSQACSKVKGLEVFLRHRISLRILTRKTRERSAKDRVSRASPQHCKPWETTWLLPFGFGVKGLGNALWSCRSALRKFAMVCAKGTFSISAKRSFCHEVILDNAHMSYVLNS